MVFLLWKLRLPIRVPQTFFFFRVTSSSFLSALVKLLELLYSFSSLNNLRLLLPFFLACRLCDSFWPCRLPFDVVVVKPKCIYGVRAANIRFPCLFCALLVCLHLFFFFSKCSVEVSEPRIFSSLFDAKKGEEKTVHSTCTVQPQALISSNNDVINNSDKP